MKIGELAARANLSASAIRYYEKLGLLAAPQRIGGQRRYPSGALQRVLLVRFATDMGFTDPGKAKDAASGPLFLSTVGSNDEVPVLVLPVNQTVRIVEHSEDVIHSFWVPEFLFKRDVIFF